MMTLSGAAYNQPGAVLLKWTAPGDDGYTGQAKGYDLRYQTCLQGPIDTEDKWRAASQAWGEPASSPAGDIDSMVVVGLNPGEKYYFCIKAYDIAGNFSPPSNSPLEVAGDSVDCAYVPGDVDSDGRVTALDVTYFINYLYKNGPPSILPEAGDMDGSGTIKIDDITYLISFLFKCEHLPVCNSIRPIQN